MINKEKISLEWIYSVAKATNVADKTLVEKVIRAFLLLEGIVIQGITFTFKGGTALMLHLESSKRLSIDIDIIVPEKINDFEQQLKMIANKQNFNKVELQHRVSSTKIIKAHYKFFYTPIYKTNKTEEYILLDILFEQVQYGKIIDKPILSRFIPTVDEPVIVKIPSIEDLLGDKLTAFAPNTTGIPYHKNEDSMSMEIIKQLYDIETLFDVSEDLKTIKNTFFKFAKTELAYRETNQTVEDVLEDIYQTALCITTRGIMGFGNINELLSGIKRVSGFIFSEKYHLEDAIISASKAAYLSILIKYDDEIIEKYNNLKQIKEWTIEEPSLTKLNKLKKSSFEAFFYWFKIAEIITKNRNYYGKKVIQDTIISNVKGGER